MYVYINGHDVCALSVVKCQNYFTILKDFNFKLTHCLIYLLLLHLYYDFLHFNIHKN